MIFQLFGKSEQLRVYLFYGRGEVVFVLFEPGAEYGAGGHGDEAVGEIDDFVGEVEVGDPALRDGREAIKGAGKLAVDGAIGVGVAAELQDFEHATFEIIISEEAPNRHGKSVHDVATEIAETFAVAMDASFDKPTVIEPAFF